MLITPKPEVSKWYKNINTNDLFEVVTLDDKDDTVVVQYFGADLEEIDAEDWNKLPLIPAVCPSDWRGALEVSPSLQDDWNELYDIRSAYFDFPPQAMK